MYSNRLRTYKKLGFMIKTDLKQKNQDAGFIYTGKDYLQVFERDLNESNTKVIIASPNLMPDKVNRLISVMRNRQEAGVLITVITGNPDDSIETDSATAYSLIKELEEAGVQVKILDENLEHFSIIDDSVVWYGGMNLLGKADAWDNLIRVQDSNVAAELMEMVNEMI